MGLDITAYKGLQKETNPQLDDDGNPSDWQQRFLAHPACIDFTEKNWPGHSAGIERGAVYSFADSFGFRAGSYGGYNSWRDWLARVAGWPSAQACWDSGKTEGPFFELIHFADNEGVIGPKVAAKLAKDFADYAAKAEQADQGDGYYLGRYHDWRKAFEMAADNGAVDFH